MQDNITSIDKLRNALPPHTADALDRYVNHGLQPGGFLTAVLEHELFEAVQRADAVNQMHLVDIVKYIYNRVPANCHGYEGVTTAWCNYFKTQQEELPSE